MTKRTPAGHEASPGYKRTDAGIIPEDWELLTGEQITTLISKGASPRWQGFAYANAGMLFVTSENVREGFLDIREPKYLPLAFHEKLKRTKLAKNDILINLVGASIGRSCRISEDLGSANVNQAVAVFRVLAELSSAFVAYYFQAPSTIARIWDMQVDAARPNISLGDLRRFLIPLPSRTEQHAIAEALSDVDALIGALDRLIAKKRDLKQAGMQQLLTGQTRLPEFRGQWGPRRVEELGIVQAGKALYADGPGHIRPYLRTKNVLDGRIDLEDVLEMPFTDAEFERYELKPGDILLNEGQSLELVGRCAMYRGELDRACAMQNQLVRFKARAGVAASFAEHQFRYCQQNGTFASIATQTTSVAHLGVVRFCKLKLHWPEDHAEQSAIAAVLSDMDAEITALEQRRDKTRLLKQGMMQELLTGKTRLV